MKKWGFLVLSILLMAGFVSCGDKTDVKPDGKVTPAPTAKPGYDKMNDTAFANVMSVLRESLENEKKAGGDSLSKLTTAKAYILVIKFIRTDKDKVKKSGMTDTDISYLVSDARAKATGRLSEIKNSPTAPVALKDEAKAKLLELESL